MAIVGRPLQIQFDGFVVRQANGRRLLPRSLGQIDEVEFDVFEFLLPLGHRRLLTNASRWPSRETVHLLNAQRRVRDGERARA